MHKLLSTDYGITCYRCGICVDYVSEDEAGGLVRDEATEAEVYRLIPFCNGPKTERAHHFIFGGDRLDCAYGDCYIDENTLPSSIEWECVGE